MISQVHSCLSLFLHCRTVIIIPAMKFLMLFILDWPTV